MIMNIKKYYRLGKVELSIFDDGSRFEKDKIGTKRWYNKDGQYHRKDGSAIEWADPECTNEWFIDGKYHRENGPAIEDSLGYKEWFYHGQRIDCQSQEEFERIIKLLLFK